jgi:hypothetical protein
MSPEWISAVSSFLTLVVIAASAIAALIQLRHMRGANQITALNDLRNYFETKTFREAMRFVYRELPKLYDDPQAREQLMATPLAERYESARTVANLFENVGVYVKRRVLDEDFTADMWGGIILTAWESMSPMIANRRRAENHPEIWENFEYLAMICKRFKDRHPNGSYPAGFPRMPEGEIWR